MKKFLAFIFCLFALKNAFSASYVIKDAKYNIIGSTREYALKTKVPIDFKREFKDEDELLKYIADIKKQIENTRNFDSVDVDFSISALPEEIKDKKEDETNFETEAENKTAENENTTKNEKYDVTLNITVDDSFHIIATPYPKYSSGDSLTLSLKAKDTNFLGSMETLTADGNFKVELDENDNPDKYSVGIGFDFETPFQLGKLDAVWGNEVDFSYTFGESTPEWGIDTSLELTKKFKKVSFVTKFSQIFNRDLDYEEEELNGETVHYGDGTYFGEQVDFSIPITIQEIDNWGKIYYTPFFNGTYYWDFDGISNENEDLRGPSISFGQKISTGRVNWIENFRNGLEASITSSFGYNFSVYDFIPSISGELKAYKAFKHFAFCTDIYGFAIMHGTYSFGDRLRGIRTDQYFDDEVYDKNPDLSKTDKATKSTAGLIVNIDLPIRICRIYWDQIPVIKKIKFVKYFNLELQLSPFVDFALFHNEAADSTFNLKDGFLSGGLEAIVYPLRWKGIQVRGSLGIDLSRKMPKASKFFNQDWRDNAKSYEISIGLGLHY